VDDASVRWRLGAAADVVDVLSNSQLQRSAQVHPAMQILTGLHHEPLNSTSQWVSTAL
jgi:hypothetical protein